MTSKYVNPYTDFGFKKIFGQEASKPLLADFLNTLLPKRHQVIDISFTNPDNAGDIVEERKAVFDIFCKNSQGERFVVEMQKADQAYFKDRTVFYSTFPIREQAVKGKWDYELKAVYCIGILNFKFQDYPHNSPETGEVIHTVELKDQNNQVFYDKLRFIYLEMPNFHKREDQLETHLDKWLYFIKHLDDFESAPRILEKDALFAQALQTAEIAKFSPAELGVYEHSLKTYRDLDNVFDAKFAKGKLEGKLEEKLLVAASLKSQGVAPSIIAAATGLSLLDIEKLPWPPSN